MSVETIKTRDGLNLVRRRWPVANPRGTVVLVHGIAEHSGRYQHVAAHLNRWGWSVESYDHRGHGLSDGPRGGLHRDDDLVADLACVMATVRREQPDGLLLLMGHSLGGLVVGCYAADLLEPKSPAGHTEIDALIMSSPALDVAPSFGMRMMLSTLGRVLPDMRVSTGFNADAVCSDPAVVKAYRDDPLIHDKISPRLARFILEGGGYVSALAPEWTLPTLLLYAGADTIVNPMGSTRFADAAPAVLHSQRFGRMAHEIFNEPDQAQVFDALQTWLDERFAREGHQRGRPRQVA